MIEAVNKQIHKKRPKLKTSERLHRNSLSSFFRNELRYKRTSSNKYWPGPAIFVRDFPVHWEIFCQRGNRYFLPF